uniref:Uncharacterized protein n=1 Tax=Cyclopterus lumpus TaxID=8103 RepID=A0A8C3AJ51_CYCLU
HGNGDKIKRKRPFWKKIVALGSIPRMLFSWIRAAPAGAMWLDGSGGTDQSEQSGSFRFEVDWTKSQSRCIELERWLLMRPSWSLVMADGCLKRLFTSKSMFSRRTAMFHCIYGWPWHLIGVMLSPW